MESLDNILSRGGESAPAADPTPAPQETTQQPAAEALQVTEPESDDAGAIDVGGQKMVPHQALHAEKQKVKRYTEQVAEFERKFEAQQAEARRFQQELLQRIAPQQQRQPQAAPDWYENPNEAALHAVAPHLSQMQDALMFNSRLAAEGRHTPETVAEAEAAFMQAVETQQLDPADYHRVVNSPNRYAAAVQWHERQQRLAPDFEDKVRAKIEAEILAKHGLTTGATAGQQPAMQAAPVMPSNLATARNVGTRSGPTWAGPTPIGDIFNRKRAPG